MTEIQLNKRKIFFYYLIHCFKFTIRFAVAIWMELDTKCSIKLVTHLNVKVQTKDKYMYVFQGAYQLPGPIGR
jgi:hypothetical protein